MQQEFLCDIAEVSVPASLGVEHKQEHFIVVVDHGGVFVYKNSCPHLGIQLDVREDEFLDMGGEFIVCANHGALFEIDSGLCIAGPCKGDRLVAVQSMCKDSQVFLLA